MTALTLRSGGSSRVGWLWRITCFLAAFLLLQVTPQSVAARGTPSSRVSVQPVLFVPKGEVEPSGDDSELLMRHLEWSQRRYQKMLGGKHTFEIAGRPVVYRAQHNLVWYRHQPQEAAPHYVAELLRYFDVDRATCRSVYVIIVVNPRDKFPNGGGRPINGSFGKGGGAVALSTYALEKMPNFQSTLQHELGHSFGLPHVDVYGYSMDSSPSIMSYNKAHHTNGLDPSPTPGTLIPEDRRGLAMNQQVFPGLQFDPARDVPRNYKLWPKVVGLKPMVLPDTDSPELEDRPRQKR